MAQKVTKPTAGLSAKTPILKLDSQSPLRQLAQKLGRKLNKEDIAKYLREEMAKSHDN